MSEHKKLFRSAGVVGAFTFVSRILGFIRDIILARLFGTNIAAQAFFVAFRIPNMLRDFVGEGVTNAAIIPIMSEYAQDKNNGKKEFWHLTNILLNILLVIVIIVSVLGVIFAPFIVKIIAFGFAQNPAKLELTIKLTRIMFPFIIFIGLASFIMSILNTLKHFTLPAAGSCFFNIIMIIFGLWVVKDWKDPIIGMAIAVLLGGMLQLCIQIPAMIKMGFRFKFVFDIHHRVMKRIGILLLPRSIGSTIYQLNIFIDTMFASLGAVVGEGAVAALYYANRLIQFPTAIFGIALATVCLPNMSEHVVANDMEKLKQTLIFSLRSLLVFLIPAAMGLLVLARPIVEVLFQRGNFDAASTQLTARALVFYCLGMFSYSGAKVVTTCFYSLKDTMTPVKITIRCLLLNIILNASLMFPLKIGGLALSTSISSTLNFLFLFFILKKRIGKINFAEIKNTLITVSIASLLMAGACVLSYSFFLGLLSPRMSLVSAIMSGLIVYILAGLPLKLFKGIIFRL